MKSRKRNINFLILFLTIFFCQSALAGTMVIDSLLPDTLWIKPVIGGTTTGSVSVPIMFVNDEALSGLEVFLTWDSPQLNIDSFSFVGGRVEYAGIRGYDIDSLNRTIIIHVIAYNEPDIVVGSGLLGSLYFSYPVTISPGFTYVDTISVQNGDIFHGTAFSDSYNNRFIPQFRIGQIELIASCCVGIRGNFNGSEDGEINITDLTAMIAYLFKEGAAPPCPEEGDIDGSFDGTVNIVDLTFFINYVFKEGPAPPDCF